MTRNSVDEAPVTKEEVTTIIDVISDAMKAAALEVLLDKEILTKTTNGISRWAKRHKDESISDMEIWIKANQISKKLFLEKVIR